MKCQKCHNPATLHITEVLGDEQFEELHLCEQCANKYLYEPQHKAVQKAPSSEAITAEPDEGPFNQHECPHCGIIFTKYLDREEPLPRTSPARNVGADDERVGLVTMLLGAQSSTSKPVAVSRAIFLLVLGVWTTTLASRVVIVDGGEELCVGFGRGGGWAAECSRDGERARS